ncbi:5'-methylthioadenosine/S-adenosylhomocysteine nucleosidase [Gulosibacter sp. 10]|uniref:5'-methylthioadenosine/S-adenosylhomocysteine nucleosidase family protein n=1 Tax=Gulosibacter sp. 10 TaxID=1255570 RepID=UPI00097F4FB3|nr:5'-methylthioadenosine/S-adenosylhomocysteine nucleosidase [Gulosibacter sp. 10]SJM55559.1 5'-methylthioadenosine nucleosidase / S-adenosylhomocysteine nucleosidase [Gulosibacter sp. 10]
MTSAPVSGPVLIACAMDEEAAAFALEDAQELEPPLAGVAARRGRLQSLDERAPGAEVVLLTTGIGLVAAAGAATWAIGAFAPRAVISAGTGGGLPADIAVGDVAVAESCTYGTADATEFGYERGQVPRQPVRFAAAEPLVEAALAGAPAALKDHLERAGSGQADAGQSCSEQDAPEQDGAERDDSGQDGSGQDDSGRDNSEQTAAAHPTTPGPVPHAAVRLGRILSGDTFVTARNVADMREAFPDAVAADMESCAIAQTAAAFGVPFISVRGISDLCGPVAGQDFHMALDEAAARSAAAVRGLLAALG